jgi:glutathione S-transferase
LTHPALRLYVDAQFTSPYALSAFVALREKRLAFEMIPVDLESAEQHGAAYAGLSLTRRVPTLVRGELALSESSAITEYLDELFPQVPVYPQDPVLRAKARQIQAWLRSDLLAIRQERSTQVIFYGVPEPALSVDAALAVDKLIGAAQAFLAHGGAHLFGQWSIADVDLALMLNRLVFNADPLPDDLREYARRQWRHPAIQAWAQRSRPPLQPPSANPRAF